MPTSYTIDHARRLVISLAWGDLTSEELSDHYERLRSDPAFDPSYRQLGDLRDAKSVSASNAMVAAVAARQPFAVGVRRALVASADAAFGIARMFATHAEGTGQTIRVFRDMASAEEWLGSK